MERLAKWKYRRPHPADVVATWADVSKAARLLGWRAQVAYDEGIGRLVAWYQENRTWAKEVATL